jgi:uncharacterized protein (DUF952 family)
MQANGRAVTTIYKICGRLEWRAAEAAGQFRGSAVDLHDGFIHFSDASQLAETVAKHFAGQTDLMLIAVDSAALGPALRWERSRNDALFPHLYGSLPLTAVRWARPVPEGFDRESSAAELAP